MNKRMAKVSGGTRRVGPKTIFDPSKTDIFFGRPGEYTLYRTGSINNTSTGGVFLGASFLRAAPYYGEDMNHNEDIKEYKLKIDNPLVIDAETEHRAVYQAYSELTGQEITSKTQLAADKKLVSALKKSQYDAILYRIKGKPYEVVVHTSKIKGVEGKSVQAHYNVWTSLGYKNKAEYQKRYGEKEAASMIRYAKSKGLKS